MVKAFPTLFPGGIGDLYDESCGETESYSSWAKHLLRYADSRFERHKIWSLYTLNWLQRKENSMNAAFFLNAF